MRGGWVEVFQLMMRWTYSFANFPRTLACVCIFPLQKQQNPWLNVASEWADWVPSVWLIWRLQTYKLRRWLTATRRFSRINVIPLESVEKGSLVLRWAAETCSFSTAAMLNGWQTIHRANLTQRNKLVIAVYFLCEEANVSIFFFFVLLPSTFPFFNPITSVLSCCLLNS